MIVVWAGAGASTLFKRSSNDVTIASAAAGRPSPISQSAAQAEFTPVSIGSSKVSNNACD